jgi:hypothetical protein
VDQLYQAGSLIESAPNDRDANTVSFYALTRPRAVRLGQVSKAATALAAARGGLGGDENGTSRVLLADLMDGETAIERQRLPPVRSLDPELVPAPPSLVRSRSWRGVSLVVAMLAIAVIPYIAIGRSSLLPTTRASRRAIARSNSLHRRCRRQRDRRRG